MKFTQVILSLIFPLMMLPSPLALAEQVAPDSSVNVPAWIVGSWKFVGYIYHNEFKPPLNPNLELIFRYDTDGTDFLYWDRIGETGFCERKGQFSVDSGTYNDEVLWTNPNNAIDCGQDPDMQVGKKTSTNIQLVNGQIQLNLGLGGEPFYYVFEAIPKYPGPGAKAN